MFDDDDDVMNDIALHLKKGTSSSTPLSFNFPYHIIEKSVSSKWNTSEKYAYVRSILKAKDNVKGNQFSLSLSHHLQDERMKNGIASNPIMYTPFSYSFSFCSKEEKSLVLLKTNKVFKKAVLQFLAKGGKYFLRKKEYIIISKFLI